MPNTIRYFWGEETKLTDCGEWAGTDADHKQWLRGKHVLLEPEEIQVPHVYVKTREIGTCCFCLTMSMQMDKGTRDCWAAQRTRDNCKDLLMHLCRTWQPMTIDNIFFHIWMYLVGGDYHCLVTSYSAKRHIVSTVPNHTQVSID